MEIDPDNWDTVQLFLRLQTQWRISPMGYRLGLEYTSVPIVCRAFSLKFTKQLFSDLQLMEFCYISEAMKHGNR